MKPPFYPISSFKSVSLRKQLSESMDFKYTKREPLEEQSKNPLHGVKLADLLEHLILQYGFEELGNRINIGCFTNNPSYKSSLKFLRRTPWAREKVEKLYLESIKP